MTVEAWPTSMATVDKARKLNWTPLSHPHTPNTKDVMTDGTVAIQKKTKIG